jgi:hypothetical protein
MEDVGIPIIRPFGLFHGYLVYFVAIWHILLLFICIYFSRFGMLYQEKSGNPAAQASEVEQNSMLR